MKYITYLLLSCTLLFSCENETKDDLESSNFIFRIGIGGYGDKLNVSFSINDVSEIPSVFVNGYKIIDLRIDGSNVSGNLYSIPYSSKIVYSINSHGKTTNGSFTSPSQPYNVTLNSKGIESSDLPIQIQKSDKYEFNWSCSSFDKFKINVGSETGTTNNESQIVTTETKIILTPEQLVGNSYIFIGAYRGSTLTPGEKPNVSGPHGKGWVTISNYFGIRYEITNLTLSKSTSETNPSVLSLHELNDLFNNLIKFEKTRQN